MGLPLMFLVPKLYEAAVAWSNCGYDRFGYLAANLLMFPLSRLTAQLAAKERSSASVSDTVGFLERSIWK